MRSKRCYLLPIRAHEIKSDPEPDKRTRIRNTDRITMGRGEQRKASKDTANLV